MKAGFPLFAAAFAAALIGGPGLLRIAADPVRLDADAPPAADDQTPGKVVGIPIERPSGGYLGVQVLDGHFRIGFYNRKQKPAPVDVASAVLRWSVHYQPNDERQVLSPGGDGVSLSSPLTVKAPLSFILHIQLFADGQSDPVETYNLSFQQ